MKKTDIALIGVVLVIIVVALFSSKGTKAQEEIEFPVTLAGEVGLNEITYSKYKEMVANGDTFVLVIERTGCYYCQQYMPILEEYTKKHKIAVVYLNTDNVSSEDMQDLSTTNKYLKRHSNWGTPTTIFMKGDRIIDSIAGFVEEDSIAAFFDGRVVMG